MLSTATGYMNDDEEPFIIFNKVEMEHMPVSDAVLQILVSAARQCYRFLHPRKLRLSRQDCWTHYVRSNYCAFLIIQRIDRLGMVDLEGLCAKLDIPHIADTLPIFVAAYQKSCSIWTNIYVDYFIAVHTVFDDIGDKMYPDCFDQDVYRQLNDFFADFLSGEEFT